MLLKNLITIHLLLPTLLFASQKETPESINYTLRKATMADEANIKILYQRVAAIPGGLARTKDEITDGYIHKAVYNGVHSGLMLVADYEDKLIASMVKYHLEPCVFSTVLAEGSILVDPDFQGKGIGSDIIKSFLKEIEDNHPEILRIELIARESNKAIKLYKKLGFKEEGRFEKRIRGISGKLEADIPLAWFNPKYDEKAALQAYEKCVESTALERLMKSSYTISSIKKQ